MLRDVLAVVLLAVSSALGAEATSQPAVGPGEIAGVVSDETGQPIAGATVDAWSWYPGNETKTDKEGKFILKKLGRDQPVEVRISKAGYSPWYSESQATGMNDLSVTLGNKTLDRPLDAPKLGKRVNVGAGAKLSTLRTSSPST